MKKRALLIVILIMSSCGNYSETAIEIAERMQSLACAGDVEGFYAYVDKLSIEQNLRKIARDCYTEFACA